MAHRSSEQDLPDPVYYRHELHAHPELSGQEHVTASTIVEWIEQMLSRYDGSLKTKIVRFKSCTAIALEILASQAGTSTMLRCELDALPIPETITAPYRSQQPERSHRCGHDGHAAIILGVIQSLLGELSVLASGRVVCLFQPAEETGYGAQWVVEADEWPSLRCDCMFALHNVPGLEQGCIYTRAGTLACASRGIHITFEGKHCHAAHPNQGLSPAVAMTEVLQLYGQPDDAAIDTGIVTVTYAQLGTTPNYGICPGEAVIQATLRSTTDEAMTLLVQSVEVELRKIGESRLIIASMDHYHHEDYFHHDTRMTCRTRTKGGHNVFGHLYSCCQHPWCCSTRYDVMLFYSESGSSHALVRGRRTADKSMRTRGFLPSGSWGPTWITYRGL
eukprot:TRINITY_DN8485_c0_g1_i4.p1 TRINITY_DN8485_c0_g1~~TRINITY_DN8485_c0_g1_i4.p1  ORF type:complete len:390 (+),score=26.53 TRINITY_DN8485_c0_g1_i4:2-1171(+)